MLKRLVASLKCAAFGHENLVLKCIQDEFLFHFGPGIKLVKVCICSRCRAVYWDFGDDVPKKTMEGLAEFDKAMADKISQFMAADMMMRGNVEETIH